MFILDIKAPTHGALTLAGTVSFVAGALVLFNSVRVPGIPTISIPLVVGTGLFIGGHLLWHSHPRAARPVVPVLTGRQTLVGKMGIVREAIAPKGQVQVAGELWTARLVEGEPALQIGERAEIVSIEGVLIYVRRLTRPV